MERLVSKLKNDKHRTSTKLNYYCVWRNFNEFFIKLDRKPDTWEQRLVLYVGYLIENKRKSTTIRSYISAVKSDLQDDGITLNQDQYLLSSLTRACRFKNDYVKMRLTIQKGLANLILDETENYFLDQNQEYLSKMFRAIFVSAYYGLLRISEVAIGEHPVRASDVHIATNKRQIIFMLRTSKTHWTDDKPQLIRINDKYGKLRVAAHHCPFNLINEFAIIRGPGYSYTEPFFIFRDGSPITPPQVRRVFKEILKILNLDADLYGFHRYRIDRATDLLKFHLTISQISKIGRWKSGIVYNYLR